MKPIVWTDIDLRLAWKRRHENYLRIVREARNEGRLGVAAFHMAYAANARAGYAHALRQHRLNDVRFFDPVAFVNSGGFELREVK